MATGDPQCEKCGRFNCFGDCFPTWHDVLGRSHVVTVAYPQVSDARVRLEAAIAEYVGDAVFARRFAECITMLKAKNADYSKGTQDVDRVAGFREIATELGLTMLEVWGVFFQKHLQAIRKYVRGGHLESEPIDGRINDAINYLVLLGALIDDMKNEVTP